MKTPSKKNLQTPTVPTTHVVPRPSLRPIPLPPPDGRKTVVIVEDQTAIRELTTEMLETRGTYRILGTAADGNQGLDMVLKLRPDILILDVMMPGLSGIEVLRRIGRNLPKMRILVFSAKQEPQVVRGLIQEGVHGFVNKNSPLSDLRKALDEIANVIRCHPILAKAKDAFPGAQVVSVRPSKTTLAELDDELSDIPF